MKMSNLKRSFFKIFFILLIFRCIEAIMPHASVPKEVREQNGISDTLIRVSAGIEDTEDLVEDFRQALED